MDNKTIKAKNLLADPPLPPLEPEENYLELSFPAWDNCISMEFNSLSRFMKKMAEAGK